MIVEAETVGQLWEDHVPHEILIGSYAALLLGTLASLHFSLGTVWAWPATALVLFLYAGCALPEGVEDLRAVFRGRCWGLEFHWATLLRFAFLTSLWVPFVFFAQLAIHDGRAILRRRAQRKAVQ